MDEEFLRKELAKLGGNLSKFARAFDLDYVEARQRFGSPESFSRRPSGPMPENIKELGQPDLTRFVIAVKAADQPDWPDRFAEAIYKARKAFDAGTHIMCQNTREDGWVVLYSIPRKQPLKNPKPFFSVEWGVQDAE